MPTTNATVPPLPLHRIDRALSHVHVFRGRDAVAFRRSHPDAVRAALDALVREGVRLEWLWAPFEQSALRALDEPDLLDETDLPGLRRLFTVVVDRARADARLLAEHLDRGHLTALFRRLLALRDGMAARILAEVADERLRPLIEVLLAVGRPVRPTELFGWGGVFPGGHVVYHTGQATEWRFDAGAIALEAPLPPALVRRAQPGWRIDVQLPDRTHVECGADGEDLVPAQLAEGLLHLGLWPTRDVEVTIDATNAMRFAGADRAWWLLAGSAWRNTTPVAGVRAQALSILIEPGGTRFTVRAGATCTIGRGDENNVPLEDGHVSRRHAVLNWTGERCTIADLGSKRGTQLNGRPLQGAMPVAPGDVIRLGMTSLVVQGAAD